ncbi:MAG: GNAT family N-acetyltransferase [Fimbriimonadaceae bacterium]|nr:GNAT family N-acetyltransferase [Chthonomonadaceae bacterium]MCO5296618.1 GNAT family N-acetyltransferase [Fimbriimonadaceae bacterium]
MRIEEAVEAFVRGFAFTRSLAHPYVVERIEDVWVMRDGPGKKGDPRNEEWVALGLAPERVDDVAGRHARGRFAVAWVCPLGESDLEERAGFKALGYRLGATEPLFVHDLQAVPVAESPAIVSRVEDPERAARLGRLLRRKPLRDEFLAEDSAWRQYVAEIDGEIVGWVASIDAGTARWCANLQVVREHRRKGIAKALMGRMLEDDRRLGDRASVLLSSHTGAHLYPTVGYRQLGTLLLYTL